MLSSPFRKFAHVFPQAANLRDWLCAQRLRIRAIRALRSARVNFHSNGLAWFRRQARMDAQPRLDAGFLVGRDDVLVLAQRLSLPASLVQVQDAPGLGLEVRIARKDPAAMLPRPDCVLVQPTPDCA